MLLMSSCIEVSKKDKEKKHCKPNLDILYTHTYNDHNRDTGNLVLAPNKRYKRNVAQYLWNAKLTG